MNDEPELGGAAVEVLEARYLRRDPEGHLAETPGELVDRVTAAVAAAEAAHGGDPEAWAERFWRLLRDLEFLPNSPTLMNAGTELGVLSGCFVLPIHDSLRSIFATLGDAALVHQAGAGTGFAFSRLRPEGDAVPATGGTASGPLSFLWLYDAAARVIREGGRRRAANMAVLDVSHPDIDLFVSAKDDLSALPTFNLSVAVTDGFMKAAVAGGGHQLVNPRTGVVVARVDAGELLDRIGRAAWRSGDPGLVFLDRIDQDNQLRSVGRIIATNPCGEVPLLEGESCNLGSISLARFVTDGRLDERRLAETVRIAIRFLDDVIDVSRYPTPALAEAARASRKVGLGVMGLAEMLAVLEFAYDSPEAVDVASSVMALIAREAAAESEGLAEERGPFPLWTRSELAREGRPPRRNAQLLSIAPTGTISLIAGTTAGIEPLFAVAYTRELLGRRRLEVNGSFEGVARARGFWSDDLVARIAGQGSIQHLAEVPPEVRRAFRCAIDLDPAAHVRMQAAVQRHVDAAVSKTVHLPNRAGPDQVRDVYVMAWRAGVKGITVYRDGSRPDQVMGTTGDPATATVSVDGTFTGGCAVGECAY